MIMREKGDTGMRLMIGAMLTVVLMGSPVWAAPVVDVSIVAKKEVVVENETGQKIRTLVEAKEMISGEKLIYEVLISNSGDAPATDLVVDDPIPAGTTYVAGSATEMGQLLFSIDEGQTYQRPTLLTYEIKALDGTTQKKVATPDQYTNIRWILPVIEPGLNVSLRFTVNVNQ